MRVEQLDKLLAAAGWTFMRTTGDTAAHRLYRDQHGHVLTVAAHGRKIEQSQLGWIRQYLRRSDHRSHHGRNAV
jgi:predicted RNA binding protein YcfA (HicA-like mRNA interferase family)